MKTAVRELSSAPTEIGSAGTQMVSGVYQTQKKLKEIQEAISRPIEAWLTELVVGSTLVKGVV